MTNIEYAPSSPTTREAGRFAIYEGEDRHTRHVIARCKPTSVEKDYSEARIGTIKLSDDGHKVTLEGTDVVFYGSDEENIELFALEACSLLFGEPRNMLMDLLSAPIRVTSEVYGTAGNYDVSDQPIQKAKPKPRKKPPKTEEAEVTSSNAVLASELEGATEVDLG